MSLVQISELSARSGVAVPTIKYYLREGLLPPGQATAATRATYDETHVQRLRLIRALVDVASMRLERVREVLAAVDDPEAGLHDVLSSAHAQLSPVPESEPSDEARARVSQLVRRHRWRVTPDGRHAGALAAALDALAAAGQPISSDTLTTYADAAATVAASEFNHLSGGSREGAATYAITGTVLAEPVLLALRRMAHENLSTRRFGRG